MADASPQNPEPWVPPNTFGGRLALLRQAKKWNVRQAAEACGVPEQSWHNWEDGRSPRNTQEVAERIAKAVPCDYVWLLAGVHSRATRSDKRGTAGQRHLSPVPTAKNPRRGKYLGPPLLAST